MSQGKIDSRERKRPIEVSSATFSRGEHVAPKKRVKIGSNTDTRSEANQTQPKDSGQQKRKSKAQQRRLISRALARGEAPPVFAEGDAAQKQPEAKDQEEGEAQKSRFIVFIGNLPFTADAESVTAHFRSIEPDSVRVPTLEASKAPTQKSGPFPGQCKGFAFLEFAGYDRMKSCLKLYHHSTFDDGKSRARKINVELTAGGGGGSVERMAKIREKNEKLSEERRRRLQELEKGKVRAARKQHKEDGDADSSDPNMANGDASQDNDDRGMHPARRAMLERSSR